MKVALMLTGLARKVQEGYDGYWRHIIENYDVDLYLHSWESKPDNITNNEDSDKVIEVYKNSKYLNIEKPFKFTKYREGIIIPNGDTSRPLEEYDVFSNFRSFPMYYSWQSTYQHILSSEIEYDCVIRSRYDISGLPLNLKEIDLNKINTAINHWKFSHIHDDNICVTNKINSDKIFTNIFDEIVNHHKKTKQLGGAEEVFFSYLERKQLNNILFKSDKINISLLRDNKLWY